MRNARDTTRGPYFLGSLSKGLEVIDCFARQSSWSLAELANTLQQSKPTIFRILHTLEEFGYVQKDTQTTRYSLGLRFHTLGSAAVHHEHLRWQALPPLQDLAIETGETVHVAILYDGGAICVQAVDGTHLVRTQSLLGKRSPAHASAMGKILLAHLPEHDVEAMFATQPLARFTANTITDLTTLVQSLRQARKDGWIVDNEEMELGVRCLAAPIRDARDRVCAALALSAPASRMDPARIARLVPGIKLATRSHLTAAWRHHPLPSRGPRSLNRTRDLKDACLLPRVDERRRYHR